MPSGRAAPERFLTTVVMTDIVGSTEHASELGDSAWRDLLELHHARVRTALRRARGREVDTAGDGFFVVFDAPASAVGFALDAARAVGELGIDIRAGVHVGEVEQMARKVTGITVVVASRIMTAAGPGEVLVSSTVRDLTAGSGLAFEDRGVRELKGVAGEWHVFAVGRTSVEHADASGLVTASERRASAVRRARDRPIWERRPRLIAGAVLGLAAVLVAGGLFVTKPWQPAALTSVAENSIGIIDPERDAVIKAIPVGTRPGGIAVDEGFAWVTNTGEDTVSQIDLAARAVVERVPVGDAPKGIAVAKGLIWVANSGERTVTRINAATRRVVGDPIEVGNGPTAIAASGDGLWVANAVDSTIVRIDAGSGAIGQRIGVAAKPVALAADDKGLWVASEDGASVSHHDPLTGATRSAPIQLNARPGALGLDATSVWVASADGKVTRIDRGGNGVTATILVGASLATIAVGGEAIWVGDVDGTIYRLDPDDPSLPRRQISTSSTIAALTAVDGDIWLAAQASASSHRGGTLRIVEWRPDKAPAYDTDPLANPFYNVASVIGDGLVGHRRVGGSAGSALLPDLAAAPPVISDGGRTYVFRLRSDLEYSTGVPVRAADFRRAFERSFRVGGIDGWGHFLFRSIVGADLCTSDDGTPVTCDLSKGIVTDDAAHTVTFLLSEPDPDFVYKLAHPAAYPVPEGVPMGDLLVGGSVPGTGPYAVTGTTNNEVRLGRNPRFKLWDAAVRPDGFPNELIFSVVQSRTQPAQMVVSNDADFTSAITEASPDLLARIETQYADRLHSGASRTVWVEMNTSIPPFDDINARKALNLAIDRRHMAALEGPGAAVTCQVLPPSFPGYQPYCPYTYQADAGGRWTAPDMKAAQAFIDASGTRGQHLTLGPTIGGPDAQFAYLAEVLVELGYDVTLDSRDMIPLPQPWWDVARTQIMINGWIPDYIAPANFLGVWRCGEYLNDYCDPGFNEAFAHALQVQTSDPATAIAEWAALDRRIVDQALVAPLFNNGAVFVSERVGNYQYNPAYSALFDQMWVQ